MANGAQPHVAMVFPVGSPTIHIQDAESVPTVKSAIIRQAITIATTTHVKVVLINHSPIVLVMFPVRERVEIIKDVANALMAKGHIRSQERPAHTKHVQTAYIKILLHVRTAIPAKKQAIHTPLAATARTVRRHFHSREQPAHIEHVQTAYINPQSPVPIAILAKNQAIHTPLAATVKMARPNAPTVINTHAATASGEAQADAPKGARTQRRAITPVRDTGRCGAMPRTWERAAYLRMQIAAKGAAYLRMQIAAPTNHVYPDLP